MTAGLPGVVTASDCCQKGVSQSDREKGVLGGVCCWHIGLGTSVLLLPRTCMVFCTAGPFPGPGVGGCLQRRNIRHMLWGRARSGKLSTFHCMPCHFVLPVIKRRESALRRQSVFEETLSFTLFSVLKNQYQGVCTERQHGVCVTKDGSSSQFAGGQQQHQNHPE